jgi:hypothetical protein
MSSPIHLSQVDFAALLAQAAPLADTARLLAAWEHDGRLGDAGGHLALLAGEQWLALERAGAGAGLDDPSAAWVVDDPRHEAAARALRDLIRDVRRGRLGGHFAPAGTHGDEMVLVHQDGPDLTPLVRAKRLAVAVDLLRETVPAEPVAPAEQVLDLDQIAAQVHLKKRSLEPYKRRSKDPLPAPDFPGGGGRRDYWRWATIRPWLVRNFSLPIPEQFPDTSRH